MLPSGPATITIAARIRMKIPLLFLIAFPPLNRKTVIMLLPVDEYSMKKIEMPPSGMRAQVHRRDTSRTAGRFCGISTERPPNCTPKENKQPPDYHVISKRV